MCFRSNQTCCVIMNRRSVLALQTDSIWIISSIPCVTSVLFTLVNPPHARRVGNSRVNELYNHRTMDFFRLEKGCFATSRSHFHVASLFLRCSYPFPKSHLSSPGCSPFAWLFYQFHENWYRWSDKQFVTSKSGNCVFCRLGSFYRARNPTLCRSNLCRRKRVHVWIAKNWC